MANADRNNILLCFLFPVGRLKSCSQLGLAVDCDQTPIIGDLDVADSRPVDIGIKTALAIQDDWWCYAVVPFVEPDDISE